MSSSERFNTSDMLYNDSQRTIQELRKENQRLRGALKFYANEDSWSTVESIEKIYFCDQGERARQALEGETK